KEGGGKAGGKAGQELVKARHGQIEEKEGRGGFGGVHAAQHQTDGGQTVRNQEISDPRHGGSRLAVRPKVNHMLHYKNRVLPFFFLFAMLLATSFSSARAQALKPALQPPATRQDNVKEGIHSVEIVDPYRLLEDQDGRETKAWVAAENAYTHSLLDGLPARANVRKRLTEMLHHDTMGAPIQEGGYYFFTKKGADQDLSSIYRRKGPDGP